MKKVKKDKDMKIKLMMIPISRFIQNLRKLTRIKNVSKIIQLAIKITNQMSHQQTNLTKFSWIDTN